MSAIERALTRRGSLVLNLDYPSRTADIGTLAAFVADRLRQWEASYALDVVTHSLGGLVLRAAVASGALPAERVRRVVMLGPPNNGSEVVDHLAAMPLIGTLFARHMGPAALELRTDADGISAQLGPAMFATGVIAGTRSFNPLFSHWLAGANDGKVRVDRTHLEGMVDHVTVPQWHPLLLFDRRVIALTMRFLDTGTFAIRPPASDVETGHLTDHP